MDSLLIVLVVIGVVMVLAGVARMRSKKRHSWDEIDHSVLFSKNEADEADDGVISKARPVGSAKPVVIEDDVDLSLAAESLGPIVAEERDDAAVAESNAFSIKIDEDEQLERQQQTNRENPTSSRARSILSKIRGEDTAEVSELESIIPVQKSYKSGAPDKVIVLNVMASNGRQFLGRQLLEALEANGLKYGDMQIFHYQPDQEPLFSLVNMVKPGSFDLENIADMTTPGVSLFVQMPNQQGNGMEAFNTMLTTAQQLAQQLGGELRDETRSVLTNSAIDLIRQQIAEYDCKWLASA